MICFATNEFIRGDDKKELQERIECLSPNFLEG